MLQKLKLDQLDLLPSKSFVSVEPMFQNDRARQIAQRQTGINEQLTYKYNELVGVVERLTADITDLRNQLAVSS